MKQLKHKKLWLSLVIIVLLVGAIFTAAGFYFFKVACVPGEKSFLSSDSKVIKKTDSLYREKTWYQKVAKKRWTIKSADQQYQLVANYIPKANANKTAIILPGYMDTKDDMGEYDALFHQLGYNTLTPDPRAQGDSQGKYIGYGWVEKQDIKKWLQLLLAKNGSKQQIVIFGVSMGAATTMMVSGEKLPRQVKALVEDCGYSNVKSEIEHEAKALYGMPAFPRFPLVEILSGINKAKVGYFLADGSSTKQLQKNHRPMLFIHGGKDTFVPTNMVYDNYRATKGPKKLWIAPKAKHADSYQDYPQTYKKQVSHFLAKYVD
ncbi:alpha/beta hydrolase [Lactobacillus sp. ESL0681]|uniref:alpha/beta hydrolase n=1 Tax=Lactobacillus sp. ESL0681 TaxID=2983211 RepID=UPI0023F6763F|nr:alpha/beta hydrolase [Lactobacillus sp. ESL0681]WEV40395.1 alpha/beta hydrolase [Lactobacillus sp. ESL0681]